MDEGDIVEQIEPFEFFNNPQHNRTKLFLSQILQHQVTHSKIGFPKLLRRESLLLEQVPLK